MAIDQKDALFMLVKSLSKSEKRQFKLYAGRLGGNAEANFMALFNLLDIIGTSDNPAEFYLCCWSNSPIELHL